METLEFNDAEVNAVYEALNARLMDLSPAMQDMGEAWLTSTETRFAQSVAPDGTPWAAKSPVTLARYGVAGGNRLRQPLIGPSRILSTTIFPEHTPESVALASNVIQAAVMQFGAEQGSLGGGAPWGDIPARPFLGVSEHDKPMIAQILTEYLKGLD